MPAEDRGALLHAFADAIDTFDVGATAQRRRDDSACLRRGSAHLRCPRGRRRHRDVELLRRDIDGRNTARRRAPDHHRLSAHTLGFTGPACEKADSGSSRARAAGSAPRLAAFQNSGQLLLRALDAARSQPFGEVDGVHGAGAGSADVETAINPPERRARTQVKAPWAPPPCKARLMAFRAVTRRSSRHPWKCWRR